MYNNILTEIAQKIIAFLGWVRSNILILRRLRQNRRYPGVSGYDSGTVGSTKFRFLVPVTQSCFTNPKTRCCTKILPKIGDIRGFQGTAGRRFDDFVSEYFHWLLGRLCHQPQASRAVLNKVLDLHGWKSWEIGRFGVVSGFCRSARWRIGLAKAYFKFRPWGKVQWKFQPNRFGRRPAQLLQEERKKERKKKWHKKA